MEKQLIISIGREFGSGGHVIAEELAKRFDIPIYDNNLLDQIAMKHHISKEELKKYDEAPKNKLFSRTVVGYSNSMEVNIANMQFNYLREMASGGESFVVVGRCSESILRGCPALVSVFVLADTEFKLERTMKLFQLSQAEAKRLITQEDYRRKSYHNYYCEGKWGDSRSYDLSVNSARMGVEKTVDLLEAYIRMRREEM